jgi:phosphonate transport system permease protein
VSEMHGVREVLVAHRAELCARYPDILIAGWGRRAPLLACCVGAIGLYVAGLVALGISPAVITSGLGRLIDIAGLMLPPDPQSWSRFLLYLGALGQTLAIASLGTLLAAILGIPFGFLAARNVVANRLIHFLSRRSLDTLRSVDTLIWALIWINVVGLGPFAGALAIMSSDIGAFGKLMSEAIEAADRRPVDGVLSAAGCTQSVSDWYRRCCPSLRARFSTFSSPTRGPPQSSGSSVPAALAFSCRSRSVFWNGSRSAS